MSTPAIVAGILLECAGNLPPICDPVFAALFGALTVGFGVVYTVGVAYRMRGGE